MMGHFCSYPCSVIRGNDAINFFLEIFSRLHTGWPWERDATGRSIQYIQNKKKDFLSYSNPNCGSYWTASEQFLQQAYGSSVLRRFLISWYNPLFQISLNDVSCMFPITGRFGTQQGVTSPLLLIHTSRHRNLHLFPIVD